MEPLQNELASAEALETESLAWLNHLLSGAVTAEQAAAFKAWRERSPEHAEAFASVVRFRQAARRAVHAERLADEAIRQHPRRLGSPKIARRALFGGAIAAAGAGVVVLHPLDRAWSTWSELASDYHTSIGGRSRLFPAPGVGVDLNTLTSASRRTLYGGAGLDLLTGEAAVTVQRPRDAPFGIQAGAGRIAIVLGAVDVRVDNGTVCVTCLRGGARVTHPDGQLLLMARQQTTYTAHRLSAPTVADPEVVAAWRRGLLIFRDAPLGEVIDQLNRYRAGRIILADASLARRPVYAVFRLRQIAQAVQQVQALTGAKVINLPGGIILLA